MYYITKITKGTSSKTGNSYTTITLMDKNGGAATLFPARELDINSIEQELISKFPDNLVPVEVEFAFSDRGVRVVAVHEA